MGSSEAARAAGLKEIPVIFVEHLSPAEQRLLSITLNRLGETGQWDEEALRIEFAELIDLCEHVVVSGVQTAWGLPLYAGAFDERVRSSTSSTAHWS